MGCALKLPPLVPATLVRRYKRFLADVVLEDQTELTVHCPNTGAMTGCAEPGRPVWLSISDNPKRKYPHTLEFVDTGSGLVSVNTHRANALVAEALSNGWIEEVGSSGEIQAEARIPDEAGRFDFAVRTLTGVVTYVEVKSATLHLGDGYGAFPDAVSERAAKHVAALERRVAGGDKAVLLFCVQHLGIRQMSIAEEIDPGCAAAVKQARRHGVTVVAYACSITADMTDMSISAVLPFSGPS